MSDIENKEELEFIVEESEAEKDQEVADPETNEGNEEEYTDESQSFEENQAFAAMRRELENKNKTIEDLIKNNKKDKKTDDEIISDMAYKENIPYEEAKIKYNETKQISNLQKEIDSLKEQLTVTTKDTKLSKLKGEKYFEFVKDDLKKLMDENPKLEAEVAYNYLVGINADKLVSESKKTTIKSNVRQKAAKRNIPNISNSSKKQVTIAKKDLDYIDSRVASGIFKDRKAGYAALKKYRDNK